MHFITARFVDRFSVGYREHGGKHYVLVKLGDATYGVEWRQADDLAADIRRRLESPGLTAATLSVTLSGTAWLMPRPLVAELRAALVAKAREAEEQERAPQIALDQALLMRAGAPIGLSSDPKIQDRAALEAAHDRDLRRFVKLGNILSKEAFGRPVITTHRAPLSDRALRSPAVRAALGRALDRR